MPVARESLLDAASRALARRPWSSVRMVDVAAAAGVSRQTLYNEFGSKDGLARALVLQEAHGTLAGIDRALAGPDDPVERLVAAAEWTAAAARRSALARALLTGCWSERLPPPALSAAPWPPAGEARRTADAPPAWPAGFLAFARDRAAAALAGPGARGADLAALAATCELVFRLALSCVLVPPDGTEVAALVRGALRGTGPVEPAPPLSAVTRGQ
ncbi:helix-turn-helix domain-containing protein [Streptomyces sp. NPDC047017]|uniref:TetR/AcrR family transcriptional regulator n=1 Tax=Streptomyces sp. NPDC047017 TaxID=3155024 RepID=UPI0033C8DE4E